ncbi:MAG: histidine kinase dimerization/phospho-acceptor domain-containing protein, partial [Bacteroidota bacterium]|nr:histidine kinase dimerization/phospho-acceptor domain-containing protein [Bacteroidota bacterium]
MKLPLSVKPKYLVLISSTLALILLIITVLDIVEGEKDFYRAKSDEAQSLLRAVQKAGENVYTSNMEVENLITEKLINTAYFISRIELNEKLTIPSLNHISASTDIEHIELYSKDGKKILSNTNTAQTDIDLQKLFPQEIDSLNSAYYDYFVPGLLQDTKGINHFYLIQKRNTREGGFIALSIASDKLLDFRKRIGIGKLFQKIADTEEIEYLVIQDNKGIITASSTINELSSIANDSFLASSLQNKSIESRIIEFNGTKVFEAVKPFTVDNEIMGIIRIGLSLKSVNSLVQRTIIRSIAISFLLLLTGIIVLILITVRQNFSLLKDEYRKIQTYTGNILANMSDGVIAADGKGIITLMNPSAENIFELKPGEAIGKTCDDIISEPQSLIDKVLGTNQPNDFWEHSVITKNEKHIIIGGSVSIIRNEDESINTVVAVIRDLTAQKASDEVQKRNEKLTAMGELAAGVAHEIKNPLNSIGITTQRFEKEFLPAEDKEEYLSLIRTMKSEVNRVSEIINQFLKFAKPPRINLNQISSKELLSEIYNSFQSRAARDNVKLSIDAEDVTVNADSSQLKQAIINIVQNAFESITGRGVIAIESYAEKEDLIIKISDTGSGISEAELGKIFNLYYTTK